MCIWHVRGWPGRHFVPHDAELAPEDERGQRDEKEPEDEQRERDQTSEERTRCDFTIADRRDCCV